MKRTVLVGIAAAPLSLAVVPSAGAAIWSIQTAKTPSGATLTSLLGVSCTTPIACTRRHPDRAVQVTARFRRPS
jgi:hypothetical protein